jgi:hypothetical protein
MATALALSRSVTLGLLGLNRIDDSGVTWMVNDLSGWRGSPQSTVQVTQRPAAPGGWASSDPQLTPRQMELTLAVLAPTSALMTAAYDQLFAAVGIGPILLTVVEDGLSRSTTVWRNGDILAQDDGGTWATYSVPLLAPDPRRYGPASVFSAVLPASAGGLSWPVSWPTSWPATVTYGDITLPGGGTTDAPLTLTIRGPATGASPLVNPLITVTTPDGAQTSLTYTDQIAVGDWLTIDCDARTVLYNGTSGRRNLLQVTDWPAVPPAGALVSFRAGSYDPSSRVEISYRPAWQ